jgi:hypothetical protein
VSDQLSWQRLFWVLRNDVMRSYRSVLVISVTAALVALVVSLGIGYFGQVGRTELFYRIFFLAALFAWGTIGTSTSFSDLHGRTTNMAFLLLPASALEKTVSRLLIYTVGLIVYLLVLTTALSWVLEGINTLWLGQRREFFSPFDRVAWLLLPHFIVTQALFFLGAAWFRKVQFVKTVGTVIAIAVAFAAIAAFLAWLVGPSTCLTADCQQFESLFDWIGDVAPVAYFYLLAPFCWFVAWLRVTETQVSHGI